MATTEHDYRALGRDDVNAIESILADDAIDFGREAHTAAVGGDAIFTWDYDRTRKGLAKLYERAKTSQWNGATDLDWSIEVDVEKVATEMQGAVAHIRERLVDLPNSPLKSWGEKEWTSFAIEAFKWRMSQFLHGEQGALICTAKIVETVPWIDAKYYASTQVMDEARHVEVFARYLDTKLDGHYPVNPALQLLIDDIIADQRWDMTYMGMQIMIEGLALAAFGFMHATTQEPLLKKLLRYVMSDEARHVAFGVLSLQEYYEGLDGKEIRERQEFAFEAAMRMRDRLMMHAVWERAGIDREGDHPDALRDPPTGREPVPSRALLEDRPELQEARAPRCRRRLAAREVHRDRRHRVRGRARHRDRVRAPRRCLGRPRGRYSVS